MKIRLAAAVAPLALAIFATPAFAQDEESGPITVSGSAALVSDYRFRGVSMTDKEMAVQAGVTVAHESGFYVGTWGSNLAGWGTFAGSNMELDVIGGYKKDMGGVTVDVGLTWYMYPGGLDNTDFAEPYVKVSGTAGPASVLVGVAYAPKQEALGKWYKNGTTAGTGVYDNPGAKADNVYIWGDVSSAIPDTGLTVKGHLGYTKGGNDGLGPQGTSISPTGEYVDWLVGADYALGNVTLGVAYVDTNLSPREYNYLTPNFSSTKDGSNIAGSRVVVSATVAF
ncbi:MAG: TorF family putative porin [Novosphingobium sp.]|nr:TorF family putative porin [Novosphingobium sp.]